MHADAGGGDALDRHAQAMGRALERVLERRGLPPLDDAAAVVRERAAGRAEAGAGADAGPDERAGTDDAALRRAALVATCEVLGERTATTEPPVSEPPAERRPDEVLGRLGEDERRAMRLHLAGFGAREIATMTGSTEDVARHRIYRGVAKLRAAERSGG